MQEKDFFSILNPGILSDEYMDSKHVDFLASRFREQRYVALPGLFKNNVMNTIEREVRKLDKYKEYKKFYMPGYQTPRNLSVIGGRKIMTFSTLLPLLYAKSDIHKLLASITGSTVYPIAHVDEYIVINRLEGPGHTHGWHLDDPKYALIIVLEGADGDSGGCLEYISQWPELCRRNGVDPENATELLLNQLGERKVVRQKLKGGDCYLLDAADCLHRVTPLEQEGSTRVALNMAYHDSLNVDYGLTAQTLYGEGSF
ncbi:hypothetical protein [Alcanivorax sp.]|uniref:HalD/BesD family halogenase n=1 Tax=Alcanivorax sp. TaxID=1872427 RepID=UPI002B26F5F1|nr:hypothetical protein [Alcanivorax sp.]